MDTNDPNKPDKSKLRKLYAENTVAQLVLDYLATVESNRRTTKVDRLVQSLKHGVSRRDVVGVLRSLEDLGCGRFWAGRRGQPSRFEWVVGLASVGRVAAKEAEDFEAAGDVDEADEKLVEHQFRLRPDLVVKFELPSNITKSEAERLAAIIKLIPV